MSNNEKKSACHAALTTCINEIHACLSNRAWLKANRGWIDEVGIEPHFSGTTCLFFNPKHDQVIRIIREVGGKWRKRYDATTITYSVDLPERTYILSDSQPPGTCRMIPVVETVAAHWEPEKVVNTFRLECREEGEPGTADVELPEADMRRESAYCMIPPQRRTGEGDL